MIIHFICRGNIFRSRIADAYFNSLGLKNIKSISSGTVAHDHSPSNIKNQEICNKVISEHGLSKFNKNGWDQLTNERLNEGDLVVFMNNIVKTECQKLFGLPQSYNVWNIADNYEITPIPTTDEEIREYAEKTLKAVTEEVDKLVLRLNSHKE